MRLRSISVFSSIGICLIIAVGSGQTVQGDDWTFFRGSAHNGSSKEKGWNPKFPESGPKIAWKARVGTGCSSVTIKGDKLLTAGNAGGKDTISCLDVKTGKTIWEFKYSCAGAPLMFDGGTRATPTIDGEFVYTFSQDGQLFCLNLSDGKKVWSKHIVKDFDGSPVTWKYSCSPLIDGNLLILETGGRDYSTVALNKKSGAPFWGTGNDRASYASPVILERDGKRLVLMYKASGVAALNIEDGEEAWHVSWTNSRRVHASSPLIIDDMMFLSCGYGKGAAMYDLKSTPPKQIWKNGDAATQISSCVGKDGHIYAVSDRGNLMCINAKDGRTIWSERGFGKGTLTIADGKLIVLSSRGDLVIAEASYKSFKQISRAKVVDGGTCWVQPVLANGRIYCKSNRGYLTCVDVSK